MRGRMMVATPSAWFVYQVLFIAEDHVSSILPFRLSFTYLIYRFYLFFFLYDFMSYQIPDLLTFLTSVLNNHVTDEDDGDLHMNPSYPDFSDNNDNDNIFETLFNSLPPQNNTTIL